MREPDVIEDPAINNLLAETLEKFNSEHKYPPYTIINVHNNSHLQILDGPDDLRERMVEELLRAGRPVLDFYPGTFSEFPTGVVPEGVIVDCAESVPQSVDVDLSLYMLTHYSHLWTEPEQQAYARSGIHLRGGVYGPEGVSLASLSANETVRELGALAKPQIVKRVVQRILDEHQAEVLLNCCPECGKLCRTPRAKQCRHCHHDWH